MNLGAAVAALAGLAACNPSEFDKALEKAPVHSVGAPSGYGAPDVGRVVLPLSPTNKPGVSARFLVASTETPNLAVIEYDGVGNAKTWSATRADTTELVGEQVAGGERR